MATEEGYPHWDVEKMYYTFSPDKLVNCEPFHQVAETSRNLGLTLENLFRVTLKPLSFSIPRLLVCKGNCFLLT